MARINKKRISRKPTNIRPLKAKEKEVKRREQLYKKVLKESRATNARLKSLRRKGKTGTWASKKLFNRIDTKVLKAITPRGRIKVQRGLTTSQLNQLFKAMTQFRKSKTSTKSGINETKKNALKSLATSLSTEENMLTEEDAEFYYDMLGTDDFEYFSKDLDIGASTLWVIIDEAIDAKDSESTFINRLSNYITIEDLDIRERAINLYNKYVVV